MSRELTVQCLCKPLGGAHRFIGIYVIRSNINLLWQLLWQMQVAVLKILKKYT